MTGRCRATVVLAVALVTALGCRRKEPAPAPTPKPPPSAAQMGIPLEPEPEDSAVRTGPPPPTVPRVEREQAVIALLRGQRPSERFPEIATDDGGAVNPALRDELSPRAETVVETHGLGDLK
ncbi:MAG TPA: hypothetical protein VF103_01840 [Polyangiaceae bacterium]